MFTLNSGKLQLITYMKVKSLGMIEALQSSIDGLINKSRMHVTKNSNKFEKVFKELKRVNLSIY